MPGGRPIRPRGGGGPGNRKRRVVIEVHTDAAGDAAASLALARQRGQALSEYFARRGGFAGQLRFEPVGAARPLVPVDGSSTEQRANRRLEVRLAE